MLQSTVMSCLLNLPLLTPSLWSHGLTCSSHSSCHCIPPLGLPHWHRGHHHCPLAGTPGTISLSQTLTLDFLKGLCVPFLQPVPCHSTVLEQPGPFVSWSEQRFLLCLLLPSIYTAILSTVLKELHLTWLQSVQLWFLSFAYVLLQLQYRHQYNFSPSSSQ